MTYIPTDDYRTDDELRLIVNIEPHGKLGIGDDYGTWLRQDSGRWRFYRFYDDPRSFWMTG